MIDVKTLHELNLKWKLVPWTEELRSFDNSKKKTVGYVHLSVGIGNQRKVQLKFKVIKGKEPVPTLLGRDFLFQHKSTEFDWEAGQIRINDEWITPHLWVKGGSYDDRIAVIRGELGDLYPICKQFWIGHK